MVDRCQDWIEGRGAGRSSSTIPTPILTRLWLQEHVRGNWVRWLPTSQV